MRRGTLTFIFGCMFSGKTTELLRRVRLREPAAVRCFRHARDRRYDPRAIVSHAGERYPACSIAAPAEILAHLDPGVELVAVEEAHFFDASLIDVLRTLVTRGVDVVSTSLDLNCWGQPLPIAETLRRLADEPLHLTTRCARCGASADHTQRLTPIVNGNLIGGPESFEPRCANCWHPPPEPPQPMPWRTTPSASAGKDDAC
ncbi:MAG TPA: thymidine kinase [Phycisphaerae bacterium]|nr:thymidine kinase [Phycisphaerae bacterium]HNU46479.1 thymidine kinase [Phycisphaerae bacterium]